jgi:hypothetical protein
MAKTHPGPRAGPLTFVIKTLQPGRTLADAQAAGIS